MKGLALEIVITQWALDSYLELKHDRTFTDQEYKQEIRPDVLLLKNYPKDPKFSNAKFWSIAESSGTRIYDGYKMKWHQVGNGKVQLRLPVGIMNEAYLCGAYVKGDPKKEKRRLEKFRTHLELIRQSRFTECGRLK
jgi:hypothetical protein